MNQYCASCILNWLFSWAVQELSYGFTSVFYRNWACILFWSLFRLQCLCFRTVNLNQRVACASINNIMGACANCSKVLFARTALWVHSDAVTKFCRLISFGDSIVIMNLRHVHCLHYIAGSYKWLPCNISKANLWKPTNKWHSSHSPWSAFGASTIVIIETAVIVTVNSDNGVCMCFVWASNAHVAF